MKIKPMTMLLAMLAGRINREQEEMINYLKEENKILREKLGRKRIILNDQQRRRLAILAQNHLLRHFNLHMNQDLFFRFQYHQ